MAINKNCDSSSDVQFNEAPALEANKCVSCLSPVMDGEGNITDYLADGVSLGNVVGGGGGGTPFACSDLSACTIDALSGIPVPTGPGALTYDGTSYTWAPAGGGTDIYITGAAFDETTGTLTLSDNDGTTNDITQVFGYTQPGSGPLAQGGPGSITYSAAFDLVNSCLEDLKALSGTTVGTTDFGELPGDQLTDNADLSTLINEIAQCLEDIKTAPAGASTTVSTPDADGIVTVDDNTNSVDICTDAPEKVRLKAGETCLYEVVAGCGAAAAPTGVELDTSKVYHFELGQSGAHFVDGAIADQHCHVVPPAAVGTGLEIIGGTYCVGGDVDVDVDVAGTVTSLAGLTGSGDLATAGMTFPVAVANLAEIREAVTAVNTAGESLVLDLWVKYCPA